MFITVPFRCMYRGKHAAMIDSQPLKLGTITEIRLYFGTDNGKPMCEWVKAEQVVPITQDEHTFEPSRPVSAPQPAGSYLDGALTFAEPQALSDGPDEQVWPV